MDKDSLRMIKMINGTFNKTCRQSILSNMVSEINSANRNVLTKFEVEINSDLASLVKVNGSEKRVLLEYINNKNNNESNFYTKIESYPKDINTGDFIEIKNTLRNTTDIFIIISVPQPKRDSELHYPVKCNQSLNWKGLSKPIPCYATNSSYGTKGVVDVDTLTMYEAKILFYTQWNDDTKNIKQDMRFIFNQDKNSTYQVVDIGRVTTGNVLRIVMDKVTYDEAKDDYINNIAYNSFLEKEDSPYIPEIISINKYGMKTISEDSNYIWNISVDYNGIDQNHISIVGKNDNSIKIKNNLGYHKNKLKLEFYSNSSGVEKRIIKEVGLIK